MSAAGRDSLFASRRALKPGDEVVVYVPWQMRDGTKPHFGPYWRGVITSCVSDPPGFVIQRDPGGEDTRAQFHRSYVFPAAYRDRVRIVGRKSPRLVVVSRDPDLGALASDASLFRGTPR